MQAKVIDGAALSRQVKVRCKERVEKLRRVRSITPGPATMTRQADILVGDVDISSVVRRAAHITPVPGGVGPMTIAMLLHNTICAAELAAASP